MVCQITTSWFTLDRDASCSRSPQQIAASCEDLLERGAMESTMMRAHRLVAQRESKRILEECRKAKRTVSDEDLELVMGCWSFAQHVTHFDRPGPGPTRPRPDQA